MNGFNDLGSKFDPCNWSCGSISNRPIPILSWRGQKKRTIREYLMGQQCSKSMKLDFYLYKHVRSPRPRFGLSFGRLLWAGWPQPYHTFNLLRRPMDYILLTFSIWKLFIRNKIYKYLKNIYTFNLFLNESWELREKYMRSLEFIRCTYNQIKLNVLITRLSL